MWWMWVALGLAGAAWSAWRLRARMSRQRRLMLLCMRAGLEFAPLDLFPDSTWVPHPLFAHPRMGTENVVWNEEAGPGLRVFDLWYEDATDEAPRAPRRWATCAVISVPFSCPRLTVAPHGLEDTVDPRGEEIRLELEEFDRRFRVECGDRRFAFAFLDQRMMQALLGLPPEVCLDANEDVVVLRAPLLAPERVLLLYEAAAAVRRHVPRVVADLYPPRPVRGPHEARWLQGRWSADAAGGGSDGGESHGDTASPLDVAPQRVPHAHPAVPNREDGRGERGWT
jgi:hypothetical protein